MDEKWISDVPCNEGERANYYPVQVVKDEELENDYRLFLRAD